VLPLALALEIKMGGASAPVLLEGAGGPGLVAPAAGVWVRDSEVVRPLGVRHFAVPEQLRHCMPPPQRRPYPCGDAVGVHPEHWDAIDMLLHVANFCHLREVAVQHVLGPGQGQGRDS
jgi:hypothetical protein